MTLCRLEVLLTSVLLVFLGIRLHHIKKLVHVLIHVTLFFLPLVSRPLFHGAKRSLPLSERMIHVNVLNLSGYLGRGPHPTYLITCVGDCTCYSATFISVPNWCHMHPTFLTMSLFSLPVIREFHNFYFTLKRVLHQILRRYYKKVSH